MSLNPKQIASLDLKPGKEPGKGYDTYPDESNGLYLYVYSKNKKWWRFRGRHNGKQLLIALGTFPRVSLKEAREKAEHLYNLLKQGINPATAIKEEKQAKQNADNNTFESVAREWQAVKKHDVTEKSKYRIIHGFEEHVFPYIGKTPISEVKAPQLLEIARKMESSGLTETTHRIIGYCSNVFLYAIAAGRAEIDPTPAVKKQLKPLPKEPEHMAATTNPAEVGKLLNVIDGYIGSSIVQAALKFAPLVFVRPGELRKALWQDIDFERREWRFIASKTRQPHVVPLSRQAIEILKDIHPKTCNSPFVFHSHTSAQREMSNNAILAAFRRMGIEKHEHCGHGWRATARTLLDEELKYPLPIIEMQLAHSVRDVHGRAYNRTIFIKERHEMMQAWADYLDKLKSTNPR